MLDRRHREVVAVVKVVEVAVLRILVGRSIVSVKVTTTTDVTAAATIARYNNNSFVVVVFGFCFPSWNHE
jgi:hypothetical protein